mmetsp:Transcript_20718/g.38881  ORF Transcript_20718/g.38881 Transcript_20718/m.38881 type:complete len:153 (+) Transcript_20718:1150-1608(+)
MPFASQLKPASTNKDKISATANVAEPAKNDQSIVFLVPNLGWSDSTVSSEIASDEITMPKLDIKMLIVFLPPRSPWNRDSSLRADAEANSIARIPLQLLQPRVATDSTKACSVFSRGNTHRKLPCCCNNPTCTPRVFRKPSLYQVCADTCLR